MSHATTALGSQVTACRPAPVSSTLRFVVHKAAVGVLGVMATMGIYRLLGAEDTGRLTLATVIASSLGLASVAGFNEVLARFGPRVEPSRMSGLFRSAVRGHVFAAAVVISLSVGAVAAGSPFLTNCGRSWCPSSS